MRWGSHQLWQPGPEQCLGPLQWIDSHWDLVQLFTRYLPPSPALFVTTITGLQPEALMNQYIAVPPCLSLSIEHKAVLFCPCSCPAEFLVQGFPELWLLSTAGLPALLKAVLPSLCAVECWQGGTGSAGCTGGVRAYRLERCTESGLSTSLGQAQRQPRLLHNTHGTAICAFCKKNGFFKSVAICVISQKEEQNIPLLPSPPPLSAPSLFCLVYIWLPRVTGRSRLATDHLCWFSKRQNVFH